MPLTEMLTMSAAPSRVAARPARTGMPGRKAAWQQQTKQKAVPQATAAAVAASAAPLSQEPSRSRHSRA